MRTRFCGWDGGRILKIVLPCIRPCCRVMKEDGMYAFFMEAAALEYHVERKCELKQLGGLLDSKGYGIGLPKGITSSLV